MKDMGKKNKSKGKPRTWRQYERGLRRLKDFGGSFKNVGRGLEKMPEDFSSIKETNKELYSRDGTCPMGSIGRPKPKQKRRRS